MHQEVFYLCYLSCPSQPHEIVYISGVFTDEVAGYFYPATISKGVPETENTTQGENDSCLINWWGTEEFLLPNTRRSGPGNQ